MTDHEDELRERVRAWKEREHSGRGGLSRAAEALGVSHSMLSEYLNGRRSAKGELLAKGIAKVLNISLDEVHGMPQRTVVLDPTQPIWANVEGWEEAARSVAEREPHLKPYLPQAGQISAYRTDRPVTRETVLLLANLVLALPDPVLRSALNAWELSTDACVARQPWVPRWAIEERIVLAAPQLRPVGETG